MPTDSGGIPAVAVSKRTSVYISSTYTILMILIFMVGWNLIIAIIMAWWPTRGDPNRQTALVALWNSGESMNAFALMTSYCERVIMYMVRGGAKGSLKDPEKGGRSDQTGAGQGPTAGSNDMGIRTESAPLDQEKQNGTLEGSSESDAKCGVSNLLWGLLFAFLALAMTVGNVVSGILVPVELVIGNFAPPAKSVIFYPDVPFYTRGDDNNAGFAKLNSLRAPAALRALGSIEASKVTVRGRMSVDVETSDGSTKAKYNYNVTGVDMGLQSDPKLQLKVYGECHTDETWLLDSNDQRDTYKLFGGNETHKIEHQPLVDFPPMVTFVIDTNTGDVSTSNTSYAMIVNTGSLYSYTAGVDPWYVTEKAGVNATVAYQVRRGRPALSCWEVSRWHLGGKDVDVSELDKLPGLKLDEFWTKKVFPYEFGAPRVATIGNAAGPSALKSASYAMAPRYILDADASAIKTDIERLLLGSWVSSRNVVRDTTTYDEGKIQGVSVGSGGLSDAAAKFVLQSGDVETLSVRILIAVPAILLFLFIFQKTLSCVLRHSKPKKKCIINGEDKDAVALVATQIFRRLDQQIGSWIWSHTEAIIPMVYPTKREETTAKTDPDPKSPAITTQQPVNVD